MIRVAICDQDAAGRIRLRDVLEHYAEELDVSNVAAVQFPSIEAFERAAARMKTGFFGLCFLRIGAPAPGWKPGGEGGQPEKGGLSPSDDEPRGVAAARRLHESHPELRMVLVSEEKSHAICSYDLDAGFLLTSGSYDDFKRTVSGPLSDIVRTRGAVASVKSGNGVENVALEDIQFVESSKRGPIIHLPSGRTVSVRGTLQSLYGILKEARSDKQGKLEEDELDASSPDGRFIKAGSSFIVNLDNVRSAGEGSLIFADGEAIIVPVRKRKAVLDALSSYCLR